MENYRESGIEQSSWETELWEEITHSMKNDYLEWTKIVNNLDFEDSLKEQWINVYKSEILNLTQGLNKDATEYEAAITVEIRNLNKQYAELCEMLKVPVKRYSLQKYTLSKCKILLTKNIESLKKMKQTHIIKMEKLIRKEEDLCKCLGLSPKGVSLKDDLHVFGEYINDLENEMYNRSEKFIGYKYEILDFLEILNIHEVDEFYRKLLTVNEDSLVYSKENLDRLEEYYYFLKEEVDDIKNKIENLKDAVTELWEITGEDSYYKECFLKKYGNTISYEVCENFIEEINRLEIIKEENFKIIVDKLRDEILKYWDMCKFSQDQRDLFKYFHYFNEDDILLKAHQDYLSCLKQIYEKNRELFLLMDNLEVLCKDYYARSTKSLNNDRYKNRGGYLLQEEREKNLLKKKILKHEDKVQKRIDEFQCIENFDYNAEHLKIYKENFLKNCQIMKPGLETCSTKKYCMKSPNLSTISLKSCNSTGKKTPNSSVITFNHLEKTNDQKTNVAKKALFLGASTSNKENEDDLCSLMYNKFKESSRFKHSSFNNSKSTAIKNRAIKKAKVKLSMKNSRLERKNRLSRYLKMKKGARDSTIVNEMIFKGVVPIEETSDIDLAA